MNNPDLKTLRVSELISIDDVSSWNKGDYILIEAQTGRGKTYFIRTTLKDVASKNKSKILLLSPRTALKKQNEMALIDDCEDIITLMNYQEIEHRILCKINIDYYDYIVADECHYMYDDSTFNRRTDITWKWLIEQKRSVKIFMSATIDLFKNSLDNQSIKYNPIYSLDPNYDYVENFYYYKSDKVIERLLFEMPKNEKAIYFTTAKKAYETSRNFDNAAFYCSSNNYHYKYADKKTETEIIKEVENLSCKILCTTNVLDAGINIKDKAFKHIIVDNFDLDTVVQMVGRRRIDSYKELNKDDIVKVYIKNPSGYFLASFYNKVLEQKKQADYLMENGSLEYIKNYQKQIKSEIIDIITIDDGEEERIECEVNLMMHIKLSKIIEDIKRYKFNKTEYLSAICKKFKITFESLLCLDDYYDVLTLDEFFKNLLGTEILEDKQQVIKEFLLNKCYSIKNEKSLRGLKTMKIGTVNKIMEEKGLPYIFESKRTRINGVQKRIWFISKRKLNVTDFT